MFYFSPMKAIQVFINGLDDNDQQKKWWDQKLMEAMTDFDKLQDLHNEMVSMFF